MSVNPELLDTVFEPTSPYVVGREKVREFSQAVFAMAPIHHHFELRGWNENQVIIRFWIISILCSLGGLALLKVI